jgi:hypothetical protein
VVRNNDYVAKTNVFVDNLNYRSKHRKNTYSISNTPEAKNYLIDIPKEFNLSHEGTYKSLNSSIAFRVVKTAKNDQCQPFNFQTCAMNLGRTFQRDQDLGPVTHLDRQFKANQTVGHAFDYYPTYRETFSALGSGSENLYFNFNALSPVDGSVIRIEAVTKSYDLDYAAKTMQNIFDSFRFYVDPSYDY